MRVQICKLVLLDGMDQAVPGRAVGPAGGRHPQRIAARRGGPEPLDRAEAESVAGVRLESLDRRHRAGHDVALAGTEPCALLHVELAGNVAHRDTGEVVEVDRRRVFERLRNERPQVFADSQLGPLASKLRGKSLDVVELVWGGRRLMVSDDWDHAHGIGLIAVAGCPHDASGAPSSPTGSRSSTSFDDVAYQNHGR